MKQFQSYLLIIICCVLFLTGCSYENKLNTKSGGNSDIVKEIDINGINHVQEISDANEIDLNINGMGHNITVLPKTPIRSISVNGQNIIVNIPTGSNPEIIKNGENIQIKYY